MQNLLHDLRDLLAQDARLVSQDGVLLKNLVVELGLKLDVDLLRLLLSHDRIQQHFFVTVDNVLVFDKDKFLQFVNNKEFLPDSYTAFKNKIGLSDDGGETYLSRHRDVTLVWPYKDCVLEGGQTQEDAKRNEVFWNMTLAPDDVDRLLDPKVLTGWRRYDTEGEHAVTELRPDDNFIIKGNNLLALYSLLPRFGGRVKLIYIDPPYNTGTDGFGYNDRFNHSTWLTFMRSRLEVAKLLLSNEGVIFIHIGDQELHYLKVMADDIFGRDSFIGTIPRKTRSGKSDVPYNLSQDFDWMLVYTKNTARSESLFQRSVDRKYYRSDDFPDDEWRLADLTTQRSIVERPNSDFTLVNPRNGDSYPVNPNRSWGVTRDSVDEYLQRNKIVFPGDYDFLNIKRPAMRVFRSEEVERKGEDFDKTYVSSDFLNHAMDDLLRNMFNSKGTDEIVDLFGEKVFAYPKNELLIQRIIEFATREGDIVLDFFLGSGTTSAVAHKMRRQYIGVEQMGYLQTTTVPRLEKVIGGEQGGISEALDWNGGGDFVYVELLEWNMKYARQIQEATSAEALQEIWKEMQSEAFLSYRIDLAAIDANAADFADLTLDDQKRFLLETLDFNALYVNLSEINDADYAVSEEDKLLNAQFYGQEW